MKGVTQRTYNEWTGESRPVKGITESEVESIYRQKYWDPVNGDQLSDAQALVLFDTAVNFGVAQAKEWWTLTQNPTCYLVVREAVYRWMGRTSATHRKNLKGWLNRVSALRDEIGYAD